MINNVIKKMLTVPGRHYLSTPFAWNVLGLYATVEVDVEGNCYQLNPQNERDGLLSEDGWLPETIELSEEDLKKRDDSFEGITEE